jgi:hypothetical protein
MNRLWRVASRACDPRHPLPTLSEGPAFFMRSLDERNKEKFDALPRVSSRIWGVFLDDSHRHPGHPANDFRL